MSVHFVLSVSLTHADSFLTGSEIWNVDAGRMTQQRKAAIVEDAFLDKKGSGTSTPVGPDIKLRLLLLLDSPPGAALRMRVAEKRYQSKRRN